MTFSKAILTQEFNHPYLFDYQDHNDSQTITLWTYSNTEDEQGVKFSVERAWLNEIITNEYGYADEEEFLTDYTFDLSHEILKKAQCLKENKGND